MKRTIKSATILCLAMTVVFFVCAFSCLQFSHGIAHATLPNEYVESVENARFDWYFQESFLNIAMVKAVVNGWFEDADGYDFESLEKDPVVVAVIDTGINFEHQIFVGNYDEEGKESQNREYDVLLRDENDEIIGKNTVVEPKFKSDGILDDSSDGHGTHVAGVIATLIHALNLEKYIKILPIKAGYPASKGSSFALASIKDAIAFACEHGADVVNMSFTSDNSAYGKAVTNEYAGQAVFVAAAGNEGKVSEGTLFSSRGYPAASANVIGVMNGSHALNSWSVYSSSNYGDAYDLLAPGFEIWSADSKDVNGYKKLNGTSMAAPFVSFGAALSTLKYRAISSATGAENKTAEQIASVVRGGYVNTLTYKKKTIKVFDLNKVVGDVGAYGLKLTLNEWERTQTLGDVKSIRITASVLPSEFSDDEILNGVKWWLDGDEKTLVGEGKTLEYLPKNEVGEQSLVAELTIDGKTVRGRTVLSVEYAVPDVETTSIEIENIEDAQIVQGERYVLSLAGQENFDPEITVEWYANGKLLGSGLNFEWAPSECGEYVVSAKVNGETLEKVAEFKVVESRAQIERTYLFTSIGVFGGIVVIAAICFVVFKIRNRRNPKPEK